MPSTGGKAVSETVARYAPGVLMAFTIAAASRFVSEHYGGPVLLFALLIGMVFYFLSETEQCAPGIQFASKSLLKFAIALLGARVTVDQLTSLGLFPLLLVPTLIIITILIGVLIARLFSRSVNFGLLTGGAVAICGASAALAISSVLPRTAAMRHDTLFTVVAVTSLSTMAMVIYPILFSGLGFSNAEIGILIGATIHDVAQVVGAGYAVSNETGDIATYVKLLRVACLPIVVLIFAVIVSRQSRGEAQSPFPWFAVAFAIILGVNSMGLIPPIIQVIMVDLSAWLLLSAIAALGMQTSIKAMADLGALHVSVIVGETVFLCAMAILAVSLL